MRAKPLAIVIVLSALAVYVFLADRKGDHYLAAFDKTQVGESLDTVIARFGEPSHIEHHSSAPGYDSGSRSACGETCWLRLWYEIPLTLGTAPVTVDFDRQNVVIDKWEPLKIAVSHFARRRERPQPLHGRMRVRKDRFSGLLYGFLPPADATSLR